MEFFFEFIPILKYMCIGLGSIGLIMLLLGVYRGNRFLQIRGGYILLLSIVLIGCGYLIYQKTKERLPEKLNEMYQPY